MTIDLRGRRKLYLLAPVTLILLGILLWSGGPTTQAVQAAPAAETPIALATTPVPTLAGDISPTVAIVVAEMAALSASPASDCEVCRPAGLPLVVAGAEPVYVTCRFRDPSQPQHGGLDFPADKYTEVRATHDGQISHAAYDPVYGNLVVIANQQWETRYAHNAYLLVRVGNRVQVGDVIALVGSTGSSSGNHLHYEVRDALNTARDPEKFLQDAADRLRLAACKKEAE